LWRIWVLAFYAFAGDQAAETFAMAIAMPEEARRQDVGHGD
jgi:hypothetical protein